MKHSNLALPLALAALAVAGCGSKSGYTAVKPTDAPSTVAVQPGQEQNLLPLAVGNQWIFDEDVISVTKNGRHETSATVTLRVAKVDNVADGKEATIEILTGNNVTNKQVWLVTKDGLYQKASGLKLDQNTPPMLLAHFPIKDDEITKSAGVGPFGKDSKTKWTATTTSKGSRIVDTALGQMTSAMFESEATYATPKFNAGSVFTIWLTPGTGIARLQQDVRLPDGGQVLQLRLKSFTPKT